MLRVFQQSIVESGIPSAVVCGGSAIRTMDANGQKLGLWLALHGGGGGAEDAVQTAGYHGEHVPTSP